MKFTNGYRLAKKKAGSLYMIVSLCYERNLMIVYVTDNLEPYLPNGSGGIKIFQFAPE